MRRGSHLSHTPVAIVRKRLAEQLPVFRALQHGDTGSRVGQCLEIAIYRALLSQNTLEYLGSFTDLDNHTDSRLYSKEEPPQSLSGKRLAGDQRLDFLVRHPEVGWAGIEAKNVREWLYPDRTEVADLLRKAVALDCVPVLILVAAFHMLHSKYCLFAVSYSTKPTTSSCPRRIGS